MAHMSFIIINKKDRSISECCFGINILLNGDYTGGVLMQHILCSA